MLRRVEEKTVSVFVALKEAATVQSMPHDSPEPTSPILNDASADTIQLAVHPHVFVITLRIPEAEKLQPGKNYGYNLRFMISGNEIHDLSSQGLLGGDHTLGYTTGNLPGFALPSLDLNKVNIFH